MCECAPEHRERARHRGAYDLLRVLCVEVERRGGVLDGIDAFDCLVESAVLRCALAKHAKRGSTQPAYLRYVRDDNDLEFVPVAR